MSSNETGDENERGRVLKERARSEKMLPITAPIRASEISAEVELTPPTPLVLKCRRM
jgi:hypothetical protein